MTSTPVVEPSATVGDFRDWEAELATEKRVHTALGEPTTLSANPNRTQLAGMQRNVEDEQEVRPPGDRGVAPGDLVAPA